MCCEYIISHVSQSHTFIGFRYPVHTHDPFLIVRIDSTVLFFVRRYLFRSRGCYSQSHLHLHMHFHFHLNLHSMRMRFPIEPVPHCKLPTYSRMDSIQQSSHSQFLLLLSRISLQLCFQIQIRSLCDACSLTRSVLLLSWKLINRPAVCEQNKFAVLLHARLFARSIDQSIV